MKNYLKTVVARALAIGLGVAFLFVGLSIFDYNAAYHSAWLPYSGGAFFGGLTFIVALVALSIKQGWWRMFSAFATLSWIMGAAIFAAVERESLLSVAFLKVSLATLVIALAISWVFTTMYYRYGVGESDESTSISS